MSEAERLAEMIEGVRAPYCGAAAAELRRLSAELAALKAAMGEPVAWMNPDDYCADSAFRWREIATFTQPLYAIPKDKP